MTIQPIVIACVLFSCAAPCDAQPSSVTGVVLDDRTGRPLAGALVYAENHTTSAEADAEGRFTLALPSGRHTIAASLIGYAVARTEVTIRPGAPAEVLIWLAEGAGALAEHVSVVGADPDGREEAVAGAALHARELQTLRGVMLDDPLRAVQALPSATATDDFYSEFAVRGSSFRHVGLTVDGIPTRYLMHTVHGATDGGSIAMINSETLGAASLLPGSYPQRAGRRLGAQVDLTTREGSREAFRGRAGLSGTSATLLLEGPLGARRGSWLVSARRSYLDLLIRQIDPDADFGFGFTDAQAKAVFDLAPRHQVETLAVAGRAAFDERADEIGANDEAATRSIAWLTAFTWRFIPSASTVITQRAYATGLRFQNDAISGVALDAGTSVDAAWRGDARIALGLHSLLEFGGDLQRLSSRRDRRRALEGSSIPTLLSAFDETGTAAAAYAHASLALTRSLVIAPGARVDYWGLTQDTTASPWLQATLKLMARTRLRAGGGIYRQFAEFDQVFGITGGGPSLSPESAVHTDLGIEHRFSDDVTLHVSGYTREERDVLWRRGSEPMRGAEGSVELGRGDAPWGNALQGRARGIELVLRRDAPGGLSGWAGYAYGKHRYHDLTTGESFWSDADQRHTVSLYANYRISHRTSVATKFRYGSNYPIAGYVGQQPFSEHAPPLFGGERPLFYGLVDRRNTLRLPAYARLDVRADRTFTWGRRRVTAFAEVANALNRKNQRNVPYGVDPRGRVLGPTDTLMPLVPSAGFVVEF